MNVAWPSQVYLFHLIVKFQGAEWIKALPGYSVCHLFSSSEMLPDNGSVHPRSSMGRLISCWLFSNHLRTWVAWLFRINRKKKKGDELNLQNFSFSSCHQVFAPITFRSLRVQTVGDLVFSPFYSCCSLKWYLVWKQQQSMSASPSIKIGILTEIS